MRHPQRHLLLFIGFVWLLLTGFLFQPTVLRDDVGRDDEVYERFTEDAAPEQRAAAFANAAAWKSKVLLYGEEALSTVANVLDTRTLVSADYYAGQQLLMLPGPVRAVASAYVQEKTELDRQLIRDLSGEEDSPGAAPRTDGGLPPALIAHRSMEADDSRSTTTAAAAAAKEAGGALPARDRAAASDAVDRRLLPLRLQTATLETDSVRRVPPLPSAIRRTNYAAGELTTIDPAHFFAVGPAYFAKQDERKGRQAYTFYSLPRRRRHPQAQRPRYAWEKFYIAINLHRNVETIPFLTGALIAFLEDELGPFFNLTTDVAVSIFANSHVDLTGALVRDFMIPYLQKAGVANIYATVRGSCDGYTRRPVRIKERIEWMACLRNKALEPLQELGLNVFEAAPDNVMDLDDATLWTNYINRTTRDAESSGHAFGRGEPLHSGVDDDSLVVIFLNDILFRPQDLTALLESVPEPVLASQTVPDGVHSLNRTTRAQSKKPAGAARVDTDTSRRARGTSFDLACGMDFYYFFYDTWVSRDRHGKPFSPAMPYTDDPETRQAFRRILAGAQHAEQEDAQELRADANRLTSAIATDGVAHRYNEHSEGGAVNERGPSTAAAAAAKVADTTRHSARQHSIPVKCCWNGVAALRGSLFLPPRLPVARNAAAASAAPRGERGVERGGGADARSSQAWPPLRWWLPDSFPAVFGRPSGAIYDRDDDDWRTLSRSQEPFDRTASAPLPGPDNTSRPMSALRRRLSQQHVQVSALRLSAERHGWREFRNARYAAYGLPRALQPPEESLARDANETPLHLHRYLDAQLAVRDRVDAHRQEERLGFFDAVPVSKQMLLALSQSATPSSRPQPAPRRVPVPLSLRAFNLYTISSDRWVQDDGVLYRARDPVLRFRQAFTPSIGASMHAATVAPARAAAVTDDVCQASECLLICEDVMQVALARYRRTPVILMNPSVRVAYEPSHFFRVSGAVAAERVTAFADGSLHRSTTSRPSASVAVWLYRSAHAYRLCEWVRDGKRRWDAATHFLAFLPAFQTAAPSAAPPRAPARRGENRDGSHLEARRITSAADDWLLDSARGDASGAVRPAAPAAVLTVAHTRHEPVSAVTDPAAADALHAVSGGTAYKTTQVEVVVDVVQFTTLTCFLASAGDAELILYPLVHASCLLVAAALIVYLVRSTNRHVERRLKEISRRTKNGGPWVSAAVAPVSSPVQPRDGSRGTPPAYPLTITVRERGVDAISAAWLSQEERWWLIAREALRQGVSGLRCRARLSVTQKSPISGKPSSGRRRDDWRGALWRTASTWAADLWRRLSAAATRSVAASMRVRRGRERVQTSPSWVLPGAAPEEPPVGADDEAVAVAVAVTASPAASAAVQQQGTLNDWRSLQDRRRTRETASAASEKSSSHLV